MGLTLGLAFLAGCSDDSGESDTPAPETGLPPVLGPVVTVAPSALMAFNESVVGAAVDFTGDLYEPTLEVSDSGVIYVTAHTILVDTTGAPVFFSRDDGASWSQLPFAGPVALPSPAQGSNPPPSDEIFLTAGDDGWLYGVDITLATFPVSGWSGDGSQLGYYNPNGYDEAQVALQASESCVPAPAKDRPWGAYANGTLLMVSNPASGPAQVGILSVPPAFPAGVGATVGGGSWNLCAGPGDLPASCRIPGIPDLRDDGRFAVPQLCGNLLYLVTGNKTDVMDTQLVELFDHATRGEITSVYGIAAFDGEDTLFVGISNNTEEDADGNQTGQMRFVASLDGGQSFVERVFVTGPGALRHFYMDGNDAGPGALVVWAVDGEANGAFDWYTAHLFVGADGGPVLENVALAIDEGPQPSAHVTGAAVGPDGRAYLAMYRSVSPGGTPLSVYIQSDGPTLPVTPAAE